MEGRKLRNWRDYASEPSDGKAGSSSNLSIFMAKRARAHYDLKRSWWIYPLGLFNGPESNLIGRG